MIVGEESRSDLPGMGSDSFSSTIRCQISPGSPRGFSREEGWKTSIPRTWGVLDRNFRIGTHEDLPAGRKRGASGPRSARPWPRHLSTARVDRTRRVGTGWEGEWIRYGSAALSQTEADVDLFAMPERIESRTKTHVDGLSSKPCPPVPCGPS